MASVARDPNGTMRVLFTNGNGDRKAIRLGRVTVKAADSFKLRVEALLTAQALRQSPDLELAAWLADVPDVMHGRLVRAGLAKPRVRMAEVTLGVLLAAFFAGVDVKPASLVRMRQVEAALVGHFTETRDVATISEADAEAWRTSLKEAGYSAATISRTVLYARQVFRWAIRRGMASGNPFANLKAGSQVNPSRSMFVDRDTITKVIDAAPDAEWRLMIALSRFGGLRVPSEALALRWSDVDWAHNRLTVRSPKTEHHEGKGERIVPLFPEVREHLQTVFEAAPEGDLNVIGRYREGCNLNTHLRRIVKRAGIKPWPRTWHNLRASRQTELAAEYPLHTACAWIGNTKAIAAGHYLQVTDADWTRATKGAGGPSRGGAQSGARAAQIAAQHPTASTREESHGSSKVPCLKDVSQPHASKRDPVRNDLMGRAGLEQPYESTGNTRVSLPSGAKSGALHDDSPSDQLPGIPIDPELAEVAAAWIDLPHAVRAGIVAMVNAAKG